MLDKEVLMNNFINEILKEYKDSEEFVSDAINFICNELFNDIKFKSDILVKELFNNKITQYEFKTKIQNLKEKEKFIKNFIKNKFNYELTDENKFIKIKDN